MQEIWSQNYDPAGNVWVSALVALIPIIFFFLALTKLRLKGYVAGTITVALSLAVALLFYRMPVANALAAGVYGFFYGLWPIAWIIVAAVFLYKVSVKTGQFDIIRSSILSVTEDQRLQLILVGFCFGAFLEGAAGFGAPVAITAALLVGLGFRPLYAAGLCLIGNTAPVAFGAMGIPVIVAGQVSGVDVMAISQMAGRQPVHDHHRAVLAHGHHGRLARRQGNLACGAGGRRQLCTRTVSDGQLHRPRTAGHHLGHLRPGDTDHFPQVLAAQAHLPLRHRAGRSRSRRRPLQADDRHGDQGLVALHHPHGHGDHLEPQALQGAVRLGRRTVRHGLQHSVPMLHNLVQKMAPVVATPTPYGAVYSFNWLSATGTAILIAAVLAILLLRLKPAVAVQTLGETFKELALPIYSIGMVLAFAFIANYSGLSTTLAMALAHTGKAFAFFSPFLGWVGVFLTGSDTSANALFGACRPRRQRSWAARGSGRDGQHHRRRDRQDDLAPVHRHCLRSRRPGRQGIGPVPLHRQAQPGLPGADRHHLHAAGLCVSVDDSHHLKLLPDPMPAIRLSDRVAQQLLELIQSTQLQSGAKLPTERALAEQLGVSRTALREAIQKLASRGVLESRVGAGTFVGSRAAVARTSRRTAGILAARRPPVPLRRAGSTPGAGAQHRLVCGPACHRQGQGPHPPLL
jgi:L-lactate permease